MSESCGSNDFSHADGEVSSMKRTHKELYLEEAESTEKMTSTAEQQSRSNVIIKFGVVLVPIWYYESLTL